MNSLITSLLIACTVVFSLHTHAQPDERMWAQRQQSALAVDILSGDTDLSDRAVFVADSLGSSRMSEEVRLALVSLLERMNDEQDAARLRGIPTNDVVNGESFMFVARVVATLDDARAIPALARVANHGYSYPVAHGLASHGERALPAIRDVIEAPGVRDSAIGSSLAALSIMVEREGAHTLSPSARDEMVRIARHSLRNPEAGILSMSRAIDLSMLLREPDLIQSIREFAYNPAALEERRMDQMTEEIFRAHAIDAIAKTVD